MGRMGVIEVRFSVHQCVYGSARGGGGGLDGTCIVTGSPCLTRLERPSSCVMCFSWRDPALQVLDSTCSGPTNNVHNRLMSSCIIGGYVHPMNPISLCSICSHALCSYLGFISKIVALIALTKASSGCGQQRGDSTSPTIVDGQLFV